MTRARLIGAAILALLLLPVAWQTAGPLVLSNTGPGLPTSISRVVLEPDPGGVALSLVLLDRAGRDTTLTGTLGIELREPDGALVQYQRSVTPADFQVLPPDSFFAGRAGYRLVIPPTAWARPPRSGQASIVVSVAPRDGPAFTTKTTEPLP